MGTRTARRMAYHFTAVARATIHTQSRCPDDEKTCRRLTDIPLVGQDIDCFEPEQDTFEVLSSLLLHCDNCTYVDIGCNIGLFAAYAARLGASVKCFEPSAGDVEALPTTHRVCISSL